jgi:alkyl hydroperoxide reductase subunit AhpF
MSDPVKRGIFDGLVRRAGGADAVAAILEARYGVGHKGTISKMCSGQIGITLDAAEALEDCLGAFPLTNRLFERTGREGVKHGDLQALAAHSTVASGQAHAALIRAFSQLSADPERLTPDERADVIAEMRAARQALTDIIDAAEAAG